MKRSVKIFAFVLASIFCFAAMSFGVFAADTCPDHPHQGWHSHSGTRPDNVGGTYYYHDMLCDVCGRLFGSEECSFSMPYDCTVTPHCILCYQTKPAEVAHDFSGAWKSVYQYHYKTCAHADCLQEINEAHTFIETTIGGTVYLVCTVCGYNRTK